MMEATHPRATGDQSPAAPTPPRIIEDHFDGHGLAESIRIEADGPGPGGASHYYSVTVDGNPEATFAAEIQFQKGPRLVEGSTPGIIEGVLYAILIDRLRSFQAGPFACYENARQLTHLEEALMWAKERAHARAKHGVLGTMTK